MDICFNFNNVLYEFDFVCLSSIVIFMYFTQIDGKLIQENVYFQLTSQRLLLTNFYENTIKSAHKMPRPYRNCVHNATSN